MVKVRKEVFLFFDIHFAHLTIDNQRSNAEINIFFAHFLRTFCALFAHFLRTFCALFAHFLRTFCAPACQQSGAKIRPCYFL